MDISGLLTRMRGVSLGAMLGALSMGAGMTGGAPLLTRAGGRRRRGSRTPGPVRPAGSKLWRKATEGGL
jgi:hypothetical protein